MRQSLIESKSKHIRKRTNNNMNVHLLIIILKSAVLILCNSAATSEQKKAVVETEFLGSHIKLNKFNNHDKGVKTHANIKNYFLYVETTKEYYDKVLTYYNESVGIEMLCYGTNLPANHTLSWHILVGTQEIATVRRNSDKPSNNITLYYDSGIYDNETRFYCSLETSDATEITTGDYFIQITRVLENNYLQIGTCNYSRGFMPTHVCQWGVDGLGFARLKPANERDVDYAEGFDYIAPEYYNSFFSTITHSCADDDTSLIRRPNGTVSITDSKSFSFTESDNGTVLFCARLNITIQTEDGSTALTKATRETYNERICLYNENILLQDKINSGIIIAILITFIIVVVGINALGIILCIYRGVKNRGKKSQKQNTDNQNDINLNRHLIDLWKKWKG